MYLAGDQDRIILSNTISFDAHILQVKCDGIRVWLQLSNQEGVALTGRLLFSSLQVFPPLNVGGVLVIAKPDGHFDPAYIVDLILSHQITGFGFTVPTLVSVILTSY